MKRINIVLIMLVVFSGLFTMQSCTEEQGTFQEFGSFTDPVLVAPANGTFLNETATVDLTWQSTDADGDPQNWTVYFGDSDDPGVIQTGYTQQTISVNVTKGLKYYWKVVAVDANGVITRGPMWSFEIIDPDAPLKMKMSWTTNVEEAIGIKVDPEDAVDLRLIIVPEAKATKIIVDGSGFEEYEDFSDLADGTYLIEADAFSTINAGDFDEPLDITISLLFNQRGILSQKLDFPKVMTNSFTCDSYYTVLAKLTKAGSVYTIESAPEAQWTAEPTSLVGNWTGTDNFDYPSRVVTSVSGDELLIYGLGFDWMEDWWGETILRGNPVPLVFDWSSLGTVTIENQYFITTLWDGDEYDYHIEGSGMLNLCGDNPVLTIEWDFIQDGWSVGGYLKEMFSTTLTLAPAGKGFKVISSDTKTHFVQKGDKPVR